MLREQTSRHTKAPVSGKLCLLASSKTTLSDATRLIFPKMVQLCLRSSALCEREMRNPFELVRRAASNTVQRAASAESRGFRHSFSKNSDDLFCTNAELRSTSPSRSMDWNSEQMWFKLAIRRFKNTAFVFQSQAKRLRNNCHSWCHTKCFCLVN